MPKSFLVLVAALSFLMGVAVGTGLVKPYPVCKRGEPISFGWQEPGRSIQVEGCVTYTLLGPV